MARIGVDVGGTNTDLILETTEQDSIGRHVFSHKVPTTIEDQSIAVMRGILELCAKARISPDEVQLIVHGTTVATNISIEHNGADVGMLTTKGFRDILHIGRHKRPYNFSLHFDVPWQSAPLVRRRNRIAINERVLPPHGQVETALDEAEVRQAALTLKSRGVEAVIIGFMYSFLNREHELRAKAIVKEVMPEAYVCCSCEVVDVMREYERFSTTAMNAYVGPRTSHYLTHLSTQLRDNGINAELRIMQSNGGVATVESCCERPVSILMSGPAGGVMGGHYFAELDGERNIITVDIGGTSADISTLVDGQIKIMNPRDSYVSGHPVLVPMIDLITIGAGGGSVAFIDAAGGFQVGPRSAGSNPGPACYNRGGQEPTVTDANIVLGRLDPDQMLGGDLKIDPQLSFKAIEDKIAKPLGMSVHQAALGILKIVNNNMALAIRSNSVARGIDPRDFVLMPFGGAGPVHGTALADEVNAKSVLIPPAPGITAAAGLLTTDLQYEALRSLLFNLNQANEANMLRLEQNLAQMEEEIRQQLRNDGVSEDNMRVSKIAECRYDGQGFELRAQVPEGPINRDAIEQIMADFHRAHEKDYGYCFGDAAVEVVSLRVIGNSKSEKLAWQPLQAAEEGDSQKAFLYERPTYFDNGEMLPTPRYDRSKLRAGQFIEGPAMLMQHDSTSLVPPGWVGRVTQYGNLIISRI
ncbi:hydantoinase/oxoprolinase family protein [Pseudomonas fluorescens]|uniref:Acetophenone carboxylase gamma subunit n=1 Tax=Pseudomonas fluorescens TaxID=294 RepID=A0A5E7EML4_PSEFL|nr:hydantoinase/oxoprolinase family protein [Pseudomonas fluorescens]VVO27822.1 Acetophenone carboxylase gamma subunit [Pseudomonas fluorescens]